ncbi:hypothetical protein [Aeromicrobium sp. UC242_57]|uniref:hypothetical protein n=1 Tax=Aeromicrobium sp. UC242_57 TaxID=3374624 RepID=UPI0037A27983
MADLTTRIALLSTSDTDLLSARASGAAYEWADPSRTSDDRLDAIVDGVDLVVVRLLGSPHDLWPGLGAVRERGVPLVILGGSLQPSAELMERVDRADGCCRTGAPLPGRRRPRQPGPAARLLVRHCPADRRGLRAARRDPGVGVR